MPRTLRSFANRTVWAGVAGLALAVPAFADPPNMCPASDDPIAASNRLIDPWVAPRAPAPPPTMPVAPAEAPRPVPAHAEPAGKALLARITSPTPAEPSQVNWSAPPPPRKPITNTLPTPERPMVPCEPVVVAPPAPPKPPEPPIEVLPPPRPLTPEDAAPPPPPPTMKATTPDDDPPQRPVTTIRFLDEPTPKPAVDDNVILAVVRRGGSATGTAADIRTAVERACHGKAACQTEVAGERQVRVMLTVHTEADWQKLYERMQLLPELGEYGLLFQVRIEK